MPIHHLTKICRTIGILALLTACSNQQLYTTIQSNERMECGKLPKTEYEECLRELDASYEEYRAEREDYRQEQQERN